MPQWRVTISAGDMLATRFSALPACSCGQQVGQACVSSGPIGWGLLTGRPWWRTRPTPNRVANIVGDEQSAAPIDSQADRPSVRVIDRDGRIGNDAPISMNDVWARTADVIYATGSAKLEWARANSRAKSANSFLGLAQGLDAFLQANALIIR